MFYLPTLNLMLALASLGLAGITIALFVDYFWYKGVFFKETLKLYAWPAIMLVTIGSVAMSLFYSEYLGFIPCSLCWLQRIAIYPQALLSVLAFKQNDTTHFPLYGIGLSIFGFVIAVYHYIYQALPKATETGGSILPCLADGSNADCAVKIMNVFGFVTFPFLSAVTFAFLIMVYLYLRKFEAAETK